MGSVGVAFDIATSLSILVAVAIFVWEWSNKKIKDACKAQLDVLKYAKDELNEIRKNINQFETETLAYKAIYKKEPELDNLLYTYYVNTRKYVDILDTTVSHLKQIIEKDKLNEIALYSKEIKEQFDKVLQQTERMAEEIDLLNKKIKESQDAITRTYLELLKV